MPVKLPGRMATRPRRRVGLTIAGHVIPSLPVTTEENTMPGLTVSEKQHWKDRIAMRIARKVEAIKSEHPALFDRARRDAHGQALQSLGLAGPYGELEAVQAEEAALARRKKRAQRAMIAALKGIPVKEVPDNFAVRYGTELPLPAEAAEAISRRQAAHQERLLADDPVGMRVAALEAEKDNLLDTIWLATSPDQIRTLWKQVGLLLGDEPTGLEREALAIEPGPGG